MAALTLAEKKRLVARFLTRCNEYADAKLEQYLEDCAAPPGSGAETLALADKISHWAAYKAFNQHAIAELETAALDAWFD